MNAIDVFTPPAGLAKAWRLVRDELASFPGRGGATLRYVLGSAVIVVTSMALQVPFLAVALIALFFAMQDNYTLSRKLTVLGLVAATGTIALSILLIKFTIEFPLLRILGAGLIAFGGIFLLRASRPLAPAGFLLAFGVTYAQSLVDIINNGEILTRFFLWVEVCGLQAAGVVLLIIYLFPSTRAAYQLKVELGRALDEVIGQLEARCAGLPSSLGLDAVERSVTRNQRLSSFAAMDDRDWARDRGRHLARVATVERLHLAASNLSARHPEQPGAEKAGMLERLIQACRDLKRDLAQGQPFRLEPDLAESRDAVLREMADALKSLADAEAAPDAGDAPAPEPLFRPDTFSNPAHLKFAFRTVLAAMACYVIYTAVAWPGIHTAMLTCIILAIPPLGMSSLGGVAHKGLVRVLGAGLGSAMALFATVFILPRLDGITGLLAMILPVIALAGWITAGSSKSNYVGRQMMFTYVLALLGRFTLTPDIPEIRDRIVGILLGVAVYLVMAVFVWPDREGESLRHMLGRLARSLAALVRSGHRQGAPGKREVDQSRAECWAILRQSRDLQTRVALEPGQEDKPDITNDDLHAGFAQAQEILRAADWLQVQLGQADPDSHPGLEQDLARFRTAAARQLELIAERVEGSTVPGFLPEHMDLAGEVPQAGDALATARALHDHIAQLGALGGEWPRSRWWRRWQDPQLDALVERAIQDGPAMAVARERVKASQARAGLVKAATGPVLGLTGTVDREEVSKNGFLGPFYNNMPVAGFTGPWYTEGTVGLEGGYTFDPWGKDKALVQAALGLHRAQLAELAETELVLSTWVVQTYVQYQAAQETLANLLLIRNLQEECRAGHDARLRRGLEERFASDLAQARKLDAEGQVRAVRQQIQILREQLRALVGAGPDDFPELVPVPLPEATGGPAPALGFELLARRPDLQAMRWHVQASLSQVDAAKAAFYPTFDLRVFYGYDALHTSDLFNRESRQINLIPGLSLPLFDSGRLNANLAQARAQSNTAIAAYNQAVVEAVRQVAQGGIEVDGLEEQLRLQGAELEAVRSAQAGIEAKQARGLVDRVVRAESELPVLAEQNKRIQLRQRRILAEVGLVRALGGGFREETPTGAER
jgi:NodT family efflux transporter outer membrane factor (OMF) lipoprotein